jgi:UDP-N-acetyl-2-amino-2-deoxyglucuronate dehydrogenase
MLDLLVWLLGDPVAVYARSARLAHGGIDVEDTIVGTITFASGALATVLATTAAFSGLPTRLQVHGASGSAVIDNDQLVYLVTGDETRPLHSVSPTLTESIPTATESSADPLADALDRQYDDFLASARTGASPLVTVVDAARTLASPTGFTDPRGTATPSPSNRSSRRRPESHRVLMDNRSRHERDVARLLDPRSPES